MGINIGINMNILINNEYILGTSGDHLGPLGTIWDLWGPSGTSGDHLGTIWEIDSMKLSVSLRIRTFRSARIDPSRRAIAEGYMYVKKIVKKKTISERVGKRSKTTKHRHSLKNPL